MAPLDVGGSDNPWQWTFRPTSDDPEQRERFATLCTLGNGVFGTRGAAAYDSAAAPAYPGTYAAGVYNRTHTVIEGEEVEAEAAVRLPNWLPLRCFAGREPLVPGPVHAVLEERYVLDLYRGILHHYLLLEASDGRRTRLHEQRAVHAVHPHLAVQKLTLHAENWSGLLQVEGGIDADMRNEQVERYQDFDTRHLTGFQASDPAAAVAWLTCHTTQSVVGAALACTVTVPNAATGSTPHRASRDGYTTRQTHVSPDRPAIIYKVATLRTSPTRSTGALRDRALADLANAGRPEDLFTSHIAAWREQWAATSLPADHPHLDVLRLYSFHLHQVVSPHSARLDVGIPARGLHGEEYQGRVFWDETTAIAWLSRTNPTLARVGLDYRYRRLSAARREARRCHAEGARYPWQSGSDGSETTVAWVKNPLSGRWNRDYTVLQQHQGAALAHSIIRYARRSGDIAYLHDEGAQMIIEIARFYATYSAHDAPTDRYHLRGVVGPDEFHDKDPNSTTPGIDDNAYTNVMAASTLHLATALWADLPAERRGALRESTGVDQNEITLWDTMSRRMFVPFHEGVLSQFSGYEHLPWMTLDELSDRYGSDLGRLDRLMEADDDHPRNYQIAKQADTLMLGSALTPKRLARTLQRLGYYHSARTWRRTVDYYLQRTVHGSTLSAAAHAAALHRIGHPDASRFYSEAMTVDLGPGTRTELGIHLGAMTAALELAVSAGGSQPLTNAAAAIDTIAVSATAPIAVHSIVLVRDRS